MSESLFSENPAVISFIENYKKYVILTLNKKLGYYFITINIQCLYCNALACINYLKHILS